MPKIVLLCFVMLITGCTSQQTATSKPTLGFDGSDLSTTVRAQDDFWMYVNGNWIEETQIPADRSSYGTFWQLIDRTEAQIRVILDELAAQESDLHADQTI